MINLVEQIFVALVQVALVGLEAVGNDDRATADPVGR